MSDRSILRLQRAASPFIGKYGMWDVLVDGKRVCSIEQGQSVDLPVSAGRHRVQISVSGGGRSAELTFTAAPDRPVRFLCRPGPLLSTMTGSKRAVHLERAGDAGTPARPARHVPGARGLPQAEYQFFDQPYETRDYGGCGAKADRWQMFHGAYAPVDTISCVRVPGHDGQHGTFPKRGWLPPRRYWADRWS